MNKKVLLCMLLFFTTACSTSEHKENDQGNEDPMYILYATPLADHPIWLQSKEGFDKACEELNIKCDWIGPKVIDTEKMDEVVLQGIIQKADGIITQGVIKPELLAQAADADIPMILVDSNIADSDKFAYYGKNFKTQAQLLLDEIEKTMGKDTKLYIGIQVAELNFDIAKDQIQEIEETFADHPGGFEIIKITESKSDKIRAQSEWMETIREYPELNVSINFAAESADACGEIAKAMHMKENLHIYGADDMASTIQYIKEGIIDASIITSFYEYGYNTVYQIYDYKKKGLRPEKVENDVKLMIVNKDNVDTYKEDQKK